jgi:hypothetical protein
MWAKTALGTQTVVVVRMWSLFGGGCCLKYTSNLSFVGLGLVSVDRFECVRNVMDNFSTQGYLKLNFICYWEKYIRF